MWLTFAGVFAPTGKITGTVVAEDGKPVNNAYVTYNRAEYRPGDTARGADRTITSADGSFSFPGLVAGTYVMCVLTTPDRYC